MQEALFDQYVSLRISPTQYTHPLVLCRRRCTACNQCFGWKKQLTRARAAAKKAGKKAGSYESNFD